MALRRTREVSGPGVAGVAVLAKPTQLRPPEWRILDRRAEMQRRAVFDRAQANESFAAKRLEFEKNGEARIKETAVQMKLNDFQAEEDSKLAARRARLRELLEKEEAEHMVAATESVETTLEKQAKMRGKARVLKERRETERAAAAEAKLDEAWAQNCEALRTLLSKKNHERVDMDRKFQVAQKQALKQQEAWVEQIYAESWEMDRLAKHARETAKLQRVRGESKHLNDCLDAQVRMLEANRVEEAELKAQEQALRFEQAALIEEEARRDAEIEAQKKRQLKRIFDKDVAQKMSQTAAEQKEALDADMKLIETLKREQANVVAEEADKKQRLRRETESYLAYLQDMKRFEQEQEKLRDEYLEAEKKKTNAKRRAAFAVEREARAQMMREVVHTLQEQMEAKWLTIMKSRADKLREAEQIAAGIAHLNQQAAEREAAIAATNRVHRDELMDQIGEIADRQELEALEDAALSQAMLDKHLREEKKINAELDRIAHLDMSVTGTGF